MAVYYLQCKLIYFMSFFYFVKVSSSFLSHRRTKRFPCEKRQKRDGEGGVKDVNSYQNDVKVYNQLCFDRFSHFDLKVNLFWL
jgi:hypothetical protein